MNNCNFFTSHSSESNGPTGADRIERKRLLKSSTAHVLNAMFNNASLKSVCETKRTISATEVELVCYVVPDVLLEFSIDVAI